MRSPSSSIVQATVGTLPGHGLLSLLGWRWVLGLFMPPAHQEVGPHANHFLLSLPRSPEVPGVGYLKEADAGPHTERGQNQKEHLTDGVTSFSKCAPVTLVTLVLYLPPRKSEPEGGVCKSSSLVSIICCC